MEIEIRIVMQGGQLSVTAPFAQKALCYGMLEMARDVIKEQAEAAQRKVLPVGQQEAAAILSGARQ